MNSFGTQSVQYGLCSPWAVEDARIRFRRDALPLLRRVNHFYMPAGRYPFRGWILLPRFEYDALDSYATSLQLNIADTTKPDNVRTIKNLSIVQAHCVTHGLTSDRDALYLIELTDGRGIASNQWFSAPINANYNVRAPAYPQGGDGSGTYYIDTMDDGTTWTWATMLQNIWGHMTSHLGAWPGLPAGAVVNGTPEGFWFPGVSAWDALNQTLDHLGLKIACDLTQASPFTIVVDGATDAALTTLQTRYLPALEDDLEWLDVGAGRVPGIVKVFFRRRNDVYGTEETVRRDSFQWSTSAVYEVSVSAPAEFSSASGRHFLWSDFTVRYDQDGQPVAADITRANQIAEERVTQYFSRIGANAYMHKTYTGALPFATGSLVDGVCWRQDPGSRTGWQTQIVYGPDPPWTDIWEQDR